MSFRKQSSSSMKKKQPSHKRLINDQYSDYRVDTNSNEFLEVCKAVYFNELSSLDEEISSSEELLLCKIFLFLVISRFNGYDLQKICVELFTSALFSFN